MNRLKQHNANWIAVACCSCRDNDAYPSTHNGNAIVDDGERGRVSILECTHTTPSLITLKMTPVDAFAAFTALPTQRTTTTSLTLLLLLTVLGAVFDDPNEHVRLPMSPRCNVGT